MSNQKKLGILQSRGLGDLLIALPIARHWHDQGWHCVWCIDQQFLSHVQHTVPWVEWIPIDRDSGTYFWDVPMQIYAQHNCDWVLPLYQSLTGHPELAARPEFQVTTFDQIKYRAAGVPFVKKWTLSNCVTRDLNREQALYESLCTHTPYVVTHLTGSDHTAALDPSWIPSHLTRIDLTPVTDSVFDWLTVLERATAIIAVDSVIANLVDQMLIADQVDSYWIPRSHIHATPVLGCAWTTLPPDTATAQRIGIFRSG